MRDRDSNRAKHTSYLLDVGVGCGVTPHHVVEGGRSSANVEDLSNRKDHIV